MTKYYSVYLYSIKDNIPYKYQVICTKVPFLNTLYQEIITDKIIYPYNPGKGLIYDHLRGGAQEIKLEEVDKWLESINEDTLKAHIEAIQTIESENIRFYEARKEQVGKENHKSKSVSKTIKRRLRNIKKDR